MKKLVIAGILLAIASEMHAVRASSGDAPMRVQPTEEQVGIMPMLHHEGQHQALPEHHIEFFQEFNIPLPAAPHPQPTGSAKPSVAPAA